MLNVECAIATVDHLLPELDRRYPGQSSDGTECREIDGVCYPTSQSGDVVVRHPDDLSGQRMMARCDTNRLDVAGIQPPLLLTG